MLGFSMHEEYGLTLHPAPPLKTRSRVQAEVLHRLCAVPGRGWRDPACILAVPDRSPSCTPPALNVSRLWQPCSWSTADQGVNSWQPDTTARAGAPACHQLLGAWPALSCAAVDATLPCLPSLQRSMCGMGAQALPPQAAQADDKLAASRVASRSMPQTSRKQGKPAPDAAMLARPDREPCPAGAGLQHGILGLPDQPPVPQLPAGRQEPYLWG